MNDAGPSIVEALAVSICLALSGAIVMWAALG